LDTTLLLDGLYQFRLTSLTDQGSSTATVALTLIGERKLGAFQTHPVDLDIPDPGLHLVVERRYDSRATEPGDFGVGWTLGVNSARARASAPAGAFWEVIQRTLFFPEFCLQPTRANQVAIAFDDRHVYRFSTQIEGDPCSVLFPW